MRQGTVNTRPLAAYLPIRFATHHVHTCVPSCVATPCCRASGDGHHSDHASA
jgi:hypothetical protein